MLVPCIVALTPSAALRTWFSIISSGKVIHQLTLEELLWSWLARFYDYQDEEDPFQDEGSTPGESHDHQKNKVVLVVNHDDQGRDLSFLSVGDVRSSQISRLLQYSVGGS